MRIVVIGAGVVGVSTAYALQANGHDVVLVDAADSTGFGATAGNAGLLTAGDSNVWASPRTLLSMPRVLLGRDDTMRVMQPWQPAMLAWGLRFLRECTPSRHRRNLAASYALSHFSVNEMRSLIATDRLDFEPVRRGLLLLFDTKKQLERATAARRSLIEAGALLRVLDRHDLQALDPAYRHVPTSAQYAIHAPNDMAGDALLFTNELLQRAQGQGLTVRFGCRASAFSAHEKQTRLHTSTEDIEADRYVVCTSHATPPLAASLGDRIHLMPAAGFSLTASIIDDQSVPVVPAINETMHVAYSRMGEKLRVTTGAVIGMAPQPPTASTRHAMAEIAETLFPNALDLTHAAYTTKARPVMARNRPLVAASTNPHVYYNTGHGPLGWTQAWGSALLISAMINKQPTPIDPAPFAL